MNGAKNSDSKTIPLATKAGKRLRWVYVVACILGAITVFSSLLFNRNLANEYRDAIEINRSLSSRQADLWEMKVLANEIHHLTVDVYGSNQADGEKEALTRLVALFEGQIETLRLKLANETALTKKEAALKQLDAIDGWAQGTIRDSRHIYDALRLGNSSLASIHMDLIDRKHAFATQSLDALSDILRKAEDHDISEQEMEALALSKEIFFVLASFVLFVVAVFAFWDILGKFYLKIVGESEAAKKRRRDAFYKNELQRFSVDEHAIVALTNAQGIIEYANESFCKISQYAVEELIGQNHRIVKSSYHPPSFFQEMRKTINSAEIWRGEICNKAKDGSLYWVKTMIVPFKDANGKIERYASIREDITSRKLDEERLIQMTGIAEKAREEAEKANQAKSEFLATMSHEIRTPMNGVIGFANLLLDGDLNESNLEYANRIKHSAEALMLVINDILDISKIEAGKMEIETKPFDLKKAIGECLKSFSKQSADKKLALRFNYKSDCPIGALADPDRVRQILVNLLGNAIKFTNEGYVNVTVERDEYGIQDKLRIKITDTGIGIPEGKQGLLFNKFAQADSSTSRKFGGTGLGLAISKLLVGLMGGEIGMKSSEGKGSCFWFTLPITSEFTLEQSVESTHGNKTAVKLKAPQGAYRILVVDDSPTNRSLMKVLLGKRIGYEVAFAENGLEAVAIIQETPVDLVFMDWMMPEMDGFEATKAIRSFEAFGQVMDSPIRGARRLPIIALTANVMEADRKRCLECGMDGYLSKPIRPNQIVEVLNEYLHQENVPIVKQPFFR